MGGTLYVVGGRWGDVGNVATLEAYDPTGDRWRALPGMPTPRGGLAAAALSDRLWVTGGEVLDESRVTFPQLEVYDPATESWG
ncbi:MAG TPA: kelch repeat-containing protein, partial [Chloroflexota bacterium]|nr:kelch repeat-containing protein [Chloroflexota bacterium]